MIYTEKIIISGNILEYYQYSKPLFKDYKVIKKAKLPHEPQQLEIDFSIPETIASKRNDNIARTRTQIRRLVNSNQDFTKFVTLTFAENLQDIKTANRHFNKFIMRLSYRYSDLKYLAIIEFQKRGAIHYHFLCNLPYIENQTLRDIWTFGHVKINKIKNVTNLGAYVCKYLSKDGNNEKMFRKKKYFCSKNLEQPEKIFDNKIIQELKNFYNLSTMQPTYKTIFSNKYIDEVKYSQFDLKNLVA
jgi:hypothetical protein